MKKTAAMFLMILAFVLVVGGNVCVAADNPDATKILMGFVKENLSAKQMSVKQVDEIRSLLDQGANVNAVDANGVTLLIAASYNGQVEIVRLLLANGAQADKATKDGNTALFLACLQGRTDVVKVLLDKGVQLDTMFNNRFTPLYAASEKGYVEIVKLLLDKNAQVNKAKVGNNTPLYAASRNGHTEIVRLLLANGAQVDKAIIDNVTPLYIASQQGHIAIVKLLLANGAQVNKATKDGHTPLYIARTKKHQDVAKLLLAKGAREKEAVKSDNAGRPAKAKGQSARYTAVVRLSKVDNQINLIEGLAGVLETKDGAMLIPMSADKPARISTIRKVEDFIVFKQGMQVQIGKGGFKLKGIFYPEGTKLIVKKDGNFSKEK